MKEGPAEAGSGKMHDSAPTLEQELAGLPDPSEDFALLPICHSTIASVFPAIAETNRLQISPCDKLKKEALYFFYGGPAFRPRGELSQSKLELPVAFIFSPEALADIDGFFPFDSGAAKGGYYESVGRFKELKRFYVRNGGNTAMKLVYNLFGTNLDYLRGRFLTNLPASEILHQIARLYMEDLTPSGVDHRKYSIECVALKDHIVSKYVEWLALPESYLGEMVRLFRHMKPRRPEYFPYESHIASDPVALAGMIAYEARKFLRKYIGDVPIAEP
jgi:hypothetical protein